MRTAWDDDEEAALQGLTTDAQVIYLRALRRHMNYETGVSSVSLGVMKRVIEFIPDASSKAQTRRVIDVSNDYIRARCAELERAGLVRRLTNKSRFDPPCFFLVMAVTGLVRPEYEPQENPKDGTTSRTLSANVVISGFQNDDQQAEPQENPKDGTPRKQVTGINCTVLYSARVDSDVPKQAGEWLELMVSEKGFSQHVAQTAKTMPMFRRWCELGVSVGDVRDAMGAAEAQLEKTPDTPMFYRNFVEQVMREKRREQGGGGHATYGRGGAGGRKLSAAELAAEQDRRFNERIVDAAEG